LGFEGGQTPLFKRLPKRGDTYDRFARMLAPVSVARIQRLVDVGRIDAGVPVTMDVLWRSGAVHKVPDGVKLICRVGWGWGGGGRGLRQLGAWFGDSGVL